jgi:hypothetical protein
MARSSSTSSRVLGWVVGVLAAVGIAIGAFFGWQALNPTVETTPEVEATSDSSWPRFVTEDELRVFGAANGPVYWAGPQDGVQYELTITDTGVFYVRYLPAGAELGEPSDDFLTVATYPNIDGYDNLVQAGARDGATSTVTQGGALIVTTPEAPLSTYFSFEGLGFQVEVYAPGEGESFSLVEDGTVEILQ